MATTRAARRVRASETRRVVKACARAAGYPESAFEVEAGWGRPRIYLHGTEYMAVPASRTTLTHKELREGWVYVGSAKGLRVHQMIRFTL